MCAFFHIFNAYNIIILINVIVKKSHLVSLTPTESVSSATQMTACQRYNEATSTASRAAAEADGDEIMGGASC